MNKNGLSLIYQYVIVQFKAKNGGAGDIYIYYDVPKTFITVGSLHHLRGTIFWYISEIILITVN